MNVTELIDFTNQLSTDESDLTPKEREQYLKYLNIANKELYVIAATGLKTIVQKVEIFLDNVTQSFLLPDDLYIIRIVFVDKLKLIPCDVDEQPSIPYNKYLALSNAIYCDMTNAGPSFPSKLDVTDNQVKKYITLFYVPLPKALVETVNDAATEIDTPVYPEPYHHFLTYGALYYFYYANKVFLDKMIFINKAWEQSKNELAKYKHYGL
jgi:hypothetical protein